MLLEFLSTTKAPTQAQARYLDANQKSGVAIPATFSTPPPLSACGWPLRPLPPAGVRTAQKHKTFIFLPTPNIFLPPPSFFFITLLPFVLSRKGSSQLIQFGTDKGFGPLCMSTSSASPTASIYFSPARFICPSPRPPPRLHRAFFSRAASGLTLQQ